MVNDFSEKTKGKNPSYIVLNLDSMYNEIFTENSHEMFAKFTPTMPKIFVLSYAMDFSNSSYKMQSSLNIDNFAAASKVNSKDKRLITTESSIADSDSFVKFLLQLD